MKLTRSARFLGCLLLLGLPAGPVQAQETEGEPPASFLSTPAPPRVSPGGAFLRSVLIPGWGHAATGAYSRGAFYFAAASGAGYMLFKSRAGHQAASTSLNNRMETAEAALRLQGVPEDSIAIRVEEDPSVQAAQSLTDSRSQQIQDWAALGIFIVLLSGADAFVSAHLMDFPEPLQIRPAPGLPGRVEVGVSIPYDGPGGR